MLLLIPFATGLAGIQGPAIGSFLQRIATTVKTSGEFLTGPECTCADILIAAWVFKCAGVDKISAPTKEWASRVTGDSTSGVELLPPKGPVYITTAINYTNGPPHMGHAYEGVTSDIIARYHRRFGREVFFMTGSDEHGKKIEQTAAKAGVKPIDICNKFAEGFQRLNTQLLVSNDFYIRTTMPMHKECAQALWEQCAQKGDIRLDIYEGWYDVKEETFLSDTDAKAQDFKNKDTGLPLERMNEESYMFSMSKYHDQLVQHITDNPECIQPDARRTEILERLNSDRLRDLSVSRATISHGIPVPGDEKHVMYVWFDALTNYLSGVDGMTKGPKSHFWPAQLHIIGKDIIWHHCVIWPCMLMSAGLPLPKQVFAHGFVQAADGRKMSKALGNGVDPVDILSRYSADLIRMFLVRRAPYGTDIKFDELDMQRMQNKELADIIGNLTHRVTNLAKKYCDESVPSALLDDRPFDVQAVTQATEEFYASLKLHLAADLAIDCVRRLNEYFTEKEPWKMHKILDMGVTENTNLRAGIVRVGLEGLYIAAHFLEPLIPEAAGKIFSKLGTNPIAISNLSVAFDNLKPGTKIVHGDILFAKIDIVDSVRTEKVENPISVAPASKQKESLLPIDSPAAVEILTRHTAQGLNVRDAKKAGDDAVIEAEVAKLLAIKAEFKALTGQNVPRPDGDKKKKKKK